MIVTVHFTGDQFVAYDEQGKEVKDRDVLNEISFMQFPGFKSTFQMFTLGALGPLGPGRESRTFHQQSQLP